MPLHVLGHVDADHGPLVVEEELGERSRQLGLADPGGAEEDERADRPVRVGEAGSAAADGVGDGGDGRVLADDPFVEVVLEADELLHLALHEPGDRNAGPAAHHLGDVLLADLLLEHDEVGLELLQLLLCGLEPLLEVGQGAVAKLGGGFEISGALGALGFGTDLLALLFHGTNGGDALLLELPVRGEAIELLAEVGELLLDRREAIR